MLCLQFTDIFLDSLVRVRAFVVLDDAVPLGVSLIFSRQHDENRNKPAILDFALSTSNSNSIKVTAECLQLKKVTLRQELAYLAPATEAL